jgi:TatD DNase family protein
MAPLVDFHCHLDLYPDLVAAVDACERGGVFTLAVTTTPRAWSRNREVTRRTKYVRAGLGLHPQLVGERAAELSMWKELLTQARYVGEVGLDAGPRFYRHWDEQKRVFDDILEACAAAGEKILSIHSVRAGKAVLDALEARLPAGRGRAVLHWFTGSASEARRAVELGCFFSLNAEMLATGKHSAWIAALPRDRLLTETDGPFTVVDGRPSEPRDVARCVALLSSTLGISDAECRALVRANLRGLIGS